MTGLDMAKKPFSFYYCLFPYGFSLEIGILFFLRSCQNALMDYFIPDFKVQEINESGMLLIIIF